MLPNMVFCRLLLPSRIILCSRWFCPCYGCLILEGPELALSC